MVTVVDWINARMDALGLRQKDVEERCGVSVATLRKLLAGKDGNDSIAVALGYGLEVDPGDFLAFYRGKITAAELDRRIRAADKRPLTPAARQALLVPLLNQARALADSIAVALQGGELAEPAMEFPDQAGPQPQPHAPAATTPKRK